MPAPDRRAFLTAALAAAAAAPLAAQAAQAPAPQGPPPAPPPAAAAGLAGSDAARLGRRRAAAVSGSGHRRARPALPPLHHLQHADQAAAHRHAVGRRPGLERRRPLPGLERHPEQRPAALDRGRRPRHDLPQPVRQQQRQHLRLRGPADLLRARQPPRGPLRAERHRSRCSPTSSRASGSTRRTTPSSIPTAASGSPIPATASAATTKATRRRAEIEGSGLPHRSEDRADRAR